MTGRAVVTALGVAVALLVYFDAFLTVFHDSWSEALYFSGYAATTLGLGDVVADTPLLRFLSVLEAFSGFALVTLAITYLLGVYGAVLKMGVLAGRVDAFFRVDDVRALDYGDPEVRSAFLRWVEQTTGELLHVLQAHFQYPILHYFRPMDPERSFVEQFRHLLAIHALVESAEAPERALGGLRDHPSVRALSRVVRKYLEDISSIVAADIDGSDDTVAQREQTYRALREYMAYPDGGS